MKKLLAILIMVLSVAVQAQYQGTANGYITGPGLNSRIPGFWQPGEGYLTLTFSNGGGVIGGATLGGTSWQGGSGIQYYKIFTSTTSSMWTGRITPNLIGFVFTPAYKDTFVFITSGAGSTMNYNFSCVDTMSPQVFIRDPVPNESLIVNVPHNIIMSKLDNSAVVRARAYYVSTDGGVNYSFLDSIVSTTFLDSVAHDTTMTWNYGKVSQAFTPTVVSNQYRVKVIVYDYSNKQGSSIVSFSVVDTTKPVVSITSPTGAESWLGGSSHDITWTATDNIGVVSRAIYFAPDSVTFTTLLDSSITNTGSWSWTLPDTTSVLCKVRVIAYDAAGNAKSSTSGKFTINKSSYTISGNAGIAGATVDGTSLTSTTADGSGNYSFTAPYGWTGTITPSVTGYTFSPTSITVSTPLAGNLTGQNFTATVPTYTITGTAASYATVAYAGTTSGTATMSGSTYTITVPYGWSGTVTPTKTMYGFSPAFRTYSNVTADQTAQNFTPSILMYTISGTVRVGSVGLEGVDILLTGAGIIMTTGSDGAYSVSVVYGSTAEIIPTKIGFTFNPTSKTFTNVTANQTQDYDATEDVGIRPVRAQVPRVFGITYQNGLVVTVDRVSDISVGVYSIAGRRVMEERFSKVQDYKRIALTVSAGLYLVRLSREGKNIEKMFPVMR
jgi:hypothetical protein